MMAAASAMFIADWCDALFIHFRVERASLQPLVPFDVDTRGGEAFVSLVAFMQKRLRFARGGRALNLLVAPLAKHEFLNLRTYVRVNDEPGIYFLAEWIPNRLAALVGPRTYGLPYRLARMRYESLSRRIEAGGKQLVIRAEPDGAVPAQPCAPGSLDEFLLERYAAFTSRKHIARRFRVSHVPWPQRAAHVEISNMELIRTIIPWLDESHLIGGNWSEGARDVSISRPIRI